ncbi:MAG: antibiotic biosynthesis monooxygenase [Deltaproteobacteria bacterium]|jgi:heme-degrading monooxygenase HmoA|nr:antibiotic biosynthesis monooxygenase [Deltaproteobacteria bacterium]MBW2480100.1 antibiotic biosynthesis monooxygenase [Deltaproteobacteria bacterium]
MAVKVLIKRRVSQDKAKALIPLVRQMRASAATQTGYITGETLRSLDNPEEFLVISTWQSSGDWKNWLKSEERNKVQEKIDDLLGGETNYEIFHYGFSE